MKNTWLLLCTLLCACLLLFTACDKQLTEQENYIGADRAIELAKEHAAKSSSEEFTAIASTLAEDDGTVLYSVTFEDSLNYYEYDVGAKDGKLLRIKRKGKPQDMPIFSFAVPNETTAPEPVETTAQ